MSKFEEERFGKVKEFFLQGDVKFESACKEVGIKPTKRQASKWLKGKGKAFKFGR